MANFDHQSGRQLDIDGARIYYEEQGSAGAPALVFLHGGLGTIEDFNRILPLFRRPYRFIGIDSRGQGKSTLGSPALTYGIMQRDVERVTQALGLEKFSIVGFSDGGIVALRLAAGGRVNIDKLVVIGTPPELEAANREIYQKLTAEGWRKKFPSTYELYRKLNPAPDFDLLVETIVRAWLDTSDDGYPRDSVKRIARDALVVRGDDDHLVSRASAFGLAESMKAAKLFTIPFAGHVVHDEQAETLMRIVNRFLEA